MIDTLPKHISYGYNLRDFQVFGINFLTGEACGYGGRILVDLDNYGLAIVNDWMGMAHPKGNEWNRGCASAMISRDSIAALAVHCLVYSGREVIVSRTDYVVMSFTMDEWMKQDEEGVDMRTQYLTVYPNSRVYVNSATAGGTRNRHEFSGRVE